MNNKMITINVLGEEVLVMNEVFGTCPKCNGDTYGESEFVYADNPYDREVCSCCGWWANTVMSSDDMEDEFEDLPELMVEMEEGEVDIIEEFGNEFAETYARMFMEFHKQKIDLDADELPFDFFLLKEAFNKACYEYSAEAKSIDVQVEHDSDVVKVTNYNIFALIPDAKRNLAIFDITLCDVEEKECQLSLN